MKDDISIYLNDPAQLEKMYRANRQSFKKAFEAIYPEVKDSPLAAFWHERLNYGSEEADRGTAGDLLFIALSCLVAGLIAKLPQLFGWNEEDFYLRNIGFIVLPLLTAYFAWKNKAGLKRMLFLGSTILASVFYINLLPSCAADTLLLSCIHLPLLLWALLGSAFAGRELPQYGGRLLFLKYNGDLAVISALILFAGALLTAITIGLFSLIGFRIEEFYFEHVVVFGLPAVPLTGTYLVKANPQLVGRISPVIARIFSPLVALMLAIYLAAIVYSGKDPYNDREFLMVFNVLLAGVMAIIFFSVAESGKEHKGKREAWVLLPLSAITLVVNGIALSAILFRISEWGLTPNRTAVLGANLLILVNLLLVAIQLFKCVTGKRDTGSVGKIIAAYLPVYFVWAAIVTFFFPLVFRFG
ncbi:MAG TPA: hypothetical protein VFR58_03385 [Flavisolibacter sp.]|nr:hypothetical protein [Flavisolibacter sp.]